MHFGPLKVVESALCQPAPKPDRGSVEQIVAHRVTAIEDIAEIVLTEVNSCEGQFHASDDIEASLWGVGDRGKTIDSAHVERQVGPADSGEFGGENQEVGAMYQRWKAPGEQQGETQVVGRDLARIGERVHLVFERQHDPGVDFEREMEIQWPTTCVFGVQIDLKGLPHGVGLYEVPFVVHMKPVMGRVIFEVGDEPRNINDGQRGRSFVRATLPSARQATVFVARRPKRGRPQRTDDDGHHRDSDTVA